MKQLLLLIAAALSATAAYAQTPFAVSGGTGSTLASVAIPATLQDKIRIQYVNATSDAASGALTFYRIDSSNIAKVTATSATGQAVINAIPYPSAAQNDVVLIHCYATNTVARGIVASATTAIVSSTTAVASLVGSGTTLVVTSSTMGSITLAANLPFNLTKGDKVYLMVPNGTIPVGATTKELNAPTVFATLEGPALIDLTGTAACRINIVAGEYR